MELKHRLNALIKYLICADGKRKHLKFSAWQILSR